MCARFTLRSGAATVAALFDLSEVPDDPPRFNVAPTQDVIAVDLDKEGHRRARHLRWGLVPSWAKDPSIGQKLINARAEGLAEKPSFKNAYQRRRCLIPADGFFEWMEVEEEVAGSPLEQGHAQMGLFGEEWPEEPARDKAPRKTKTTKQPFYIGLKDFSPFAFAGLWEFWQEDGHDPLRTCTIITTTPNELVRPLHDRMPVILTPDRFDMWLDPRMPMEALDSLLEPLDASTMEAYPVNPIVNSPKNDSPECVEPIDLDHQKT